MPVQHDTSLRAGAHLASAVAGLIEATCGVEPQGVSVSAPAATIHIKLGVASAEALERACDYARWSSRGSGWSVKVTARTPKEEPKQ